MFRTWSNNAGYPILNVDLSRGIGRTVRMHISQELFSPFINETENSEFFILFNYVTSQRASAEYWQPEKSEWHWIDNENTTETEIELESQANWVIFNLQQTGEFIFLEIKSFCCFLLLFNANCCLLLHII